jgi:hypothetical protein
MMNQLDNFIPLIWESDGHFSPHCTERDNMYAVNGIPHAVFQGQGMSVGGLSSGSMYSYYLPFYNQYIGDDSPVYMDITMPTNSSGGVDIEVDVVMTGSINTTNNKILFMLTYNYSATYCATVSRYHEEPFNLNLTGQEATFSHSFDLENSWDLENIKGVVLIQTFTSSGNGYDGSYGPYPMYPIHQAGITGVTLDPDVELTLIHQDNWNMVGLPLGVEDSDYITLFPDAIANTLFSFGEGYSLETNLVEGTGYWLRFDGYGSTTMIGDDFEEITITLDEDWNMISGVSNPADVNSISDPYGIIVPNTIYSFGEGYNLADVIEPGLGYWIRSYTEGSITISSTAASGKSKFVNRLTDANSISFNGQTLYFGVEIPQEEILSYSLPPKPPAGALDVRYEGDWKVVKDDGNIEIMNNSNELKIDYEIHQDNWVLINQLTGEEYSLTNSGTIDLVGDVTGFTLMKEDAALPSQYALAQNYPNPFNPVTTISYSVPFPGPISLKVYGLLGEEVSTVVEGEHKAGFHTAQFDGSHLSSGVYFYRLSSKDHTITKKLILMK